MWFAYPAGHVLLSAGQVARLSSIGLKRGLPDVFLLFNGGVFAIELKRRGGRLSKTRVGRTARGSPRVLDGQEDVFKRLMAAGVTIGVAHSVDEALALVKEWGLPLRGYA